MQFDQDGTYARQIQRRQQLGLAAFDVAQKNSWTIALEERVCVIDPNLLDTLVVEPLDRCARPEILRREQLGFAVFPASRANQQRWRDAVQLEVGADEWLQLRVRFN